MNMKHNNRKPAKKEGQSRKVRRKERREMNRDTKEERGNKALSDEAKVYNEDFKLDWFQPTEAQLDIVESMCCNDLTCCLASSGCGKSTTVIWKALQDLKRGCYQQILFIKSPAEMGDDTIGFLTGDKNAKLESHFSSMRSIFHSFMSPQKLEMMEKREQIKFEIPNYLGGMTFDNTLVIIDESQLLSPSTVKLCLERAGQDSSVVMIGDSKQAYAAKHRDDGFTDFIKRITRIDEDGNRVSKESTMGFIRLTSRDNMRSALSKRIVELYEDEEDSEF